MTAPPHDPAAHPQTGPVAAAHDAVADDDASGSPLQAHPLPPLPVRSARDADGWRALPPRARWLYIISTAIGVSITAFAAALVPLFTVLRGHGLVLLSAAVLLGAVTGALYGNRRYVNTRWRHDGDGFALQRGRLWQSDTRVPGSRVQHLDLKRGPVERLCGLATLVVHTAGTRHSAVALSGLDHADAERLRDALSRQTEDDDDG